MVRHATAYDRGQAEDCDILGYVDGCECDSAHDSICLRLMTVT